jgi:hypothetical protein
MSEFDDRSELTILGLAGGWRSIESVRPHWSSSSGQEASSYTLLSRCGAARIAEWFLRVATKVEKNKNEKRLGSLPYAATSLAFLYGNKMHRSALKSKTN